MSVTIRAAAAAFAVLLAVSSQSVAQDAPISAGELHAEFNAWVGRQITVAGYAGWISSSVTVAPDPENSASGMVSCRFAEKTERQEFSGMTAVIVRGTFQFRTGGDNPRIRLADCEVLSIGGDLPEGADPELDGDAPILAGDLIAAAFGIEGRAVQVAGFLGGSRYFGRADKTSHDLQDDEDGEALVYCSQEGRTEVPDVVLSQRENIIVEGEISVAPNGGNIPVLANCRFTVPE